MKKVIPPVLFIFCTLLIIGLKFLFPEQSMLKPAFSYLGSIFIIAGLVMTSRVRKLFDQVNTEIHTFK